MSALREFSKGGALDDRPHSGEAVGVLDPHEPRDPVRGGERRQMRGQLFDSSLTWFGEFLDVPCRDFDCFRIHREHEKPGEWSVYLQISERDSGGEAATGDEESAGTACVGFGELPLHMALPSWVSKFIISFSDPLGLTLPIRVGSLVAHHARKDPGRRP